MAKTRRLERDVDFDAKAVTFRPVGSDKEIRVSPKDFPPAIRNMLVLAGINSRIGDPASMSDNPEESLTRTIEQLKNGEWSVQGKSRVTMLEEALSRVTGQPVEEVREKWREKTESERKGYEKDPDVQLAIKSIQLERAERRAKRKPEKKVLTL